MAQPAWSNQPAQPVHPTGVTPPFGELSTAIDSLRVKQVIAGVTAVFFCEKLSTLLGWQNHPVAGMLGVMIPGLTELPVLGRTVVG